MRTRVPLSLECVTGGTDAFALLVWSIFVDGAVSAPHSPGRNPLMQRRVDELAVIAEAREDTTDYFRVMMVGDSTMEHQYGVVCAFLGEREGRRFDREVWTPRLRKMFAFGSIYPAFDARVSHLFDDCIWGLLYYLASRCSTALCMIYNYLPWLRGSR